MGKSSEPIVFAFIDSQNLNLGVSNDITDSTAKRILYKGWKLDFGKFRLYLKNKYGVSKAYLFIGQVPGNESLYRYLQEVGYIVVFKPTMPVRNKGMRETKGNVDAELVLYASALTYDEYDKAIIISGDGDFHCLVEYLDAQDKLLHIFAPNMRYSSLLNKYASKIVRVDKLKDKLEAKNKTGLGGRSKP